VNANWRSRRLSMVRMERESGRREREEDGAESGRRGEGGGWSGEREKGRKGEGTGKFGITHGDVLDHLITRAPFVPPSKPCPACKSSPSLVA